MFCTPSPFATFLHYTKPLKISQSNITAQHCNPTDRLYSYKVFFLLLLRQQGVQVLLLEDNQGLVLYGGDIWSSHCRERKWVGRE